jgi:hypothetical protein
MKNINELLKTRSKVVLVLGVVSILYCISSIAVLLLATGLVNVNDILYYNPRVLIAYSVIAFAWSIFLSIFFVTNALGRRRRRDDR